MTRVWVITGSSRGLGRALAEATLVALEALGRADAPSDLLLSLDLRVEHLLVDEFQDTSFAQCELIERVTAGWDAPLMGPLGVPPIGISRDSS